MEKKENFIEYNEIKTNNLKSVDVKIKKNTLVSVAGPSGSGKSSLAYGTIFNISKFEEAQLKNDDSVEKNYRIKSYKNIIPAVDLKQINLNSNPRSTIATFLNLDTQFKVIYGRENNVSPSIFTFNMPNSACKTCNGLGYVLSLDEDKIVDEQKSIKDGAFIPWKTSTLGYEQKLLIKFAEDNSIPIDKKISDLTDNQKNLLLFCKQSQKKYKISYKAYKKPRNKEFYYVGIMTLQNKFKLSNRASGIQKIKKYTEYEECPSCKGQRFNEEILNYKFLNKSLGEMYNMEIFKLCEFLKNENKQENQEVTNIITLLEEIITSNLGYLNLNRSIPTLSGGELQRIRLVNILSSKISNMLYVIDEPSAKLHVTEYESLYENLTKIKNRDNTVLLVEHNPYFLKRSDEVIYIGPKAGKYGGQKITKEQYLLENLFISKEKENTSKEVKNNELIKVENIKKNNLKDISLKLPKNSLIGIYGVSGSGKSTLCKEVSKRLSNSVYIDQKPIRGSSVSTIGTYSGTLFKDIREEVAEKLKISNSNIFNFNSEEGKCKVCDGKGKIKFQYDYGKEMDILCHSCRGKRYSEIVLRNKKYQYKSRNIYEILNLSIQELIDEKIFEIKKINDKLELLNKLGLGHLSLFRTTDTLSGGESQRVKLSDTLGKKVKDKIIFFDEPLSGLSSKDSLNILNIFKILVKKGATIIFIEHNVLGIKESDYIIEVGPGKGKDGGKIIFENHIDKFLKSENYNKYKIMMMDR